jgi:hypothetical protein
MALEEGKTTCISSLLPVHLPKALFPVACRRANPVPPETAGLKPNGTLNGLLGSSLNELLSDPTVLVSPYLVSNWCQLHDSTGTQRNNITFCWSL